MNLKILLAISLFTIFSCTENETKRPTTSLDTGRDFIRATLDGDFKAAETLLYKDSQNIQIFESYKTYYNRLPDEKKQAYKKASYNINTFTDENDSTSIIDYSNSYMNQPMKIKIIKNDKLWSVDFKYTSGDTTNTK